MIHPVVLAQRWWDDYIHGMELLLVFSDLHGDEHALDLLLVRAEEEHATGLLCAGDVGLERLGRHREAFGTLHIPIRFVKGNCDSLWSFSDMGLQLPPRYLTHPFAGRTICMSHGHIIHTWQEFPLLMMEKDIFISGHTHIARLEWNQGEPIVLNPGSVTSPRDGRSPSYAIINEEGIWLKELTSGNGMGQLMFKDRYNMLETVSASFT